MALTLILFVLLTISIYEIYLTFLNAISAPTNERAAVWGILCVGCIVVTLLLAILLLGQ